MCKFKKSFSAILLLSYLTLTPAHAALVEVVIVGNIETTNGSARPLIGSIFTIKTVYDTSFTDRDYSFSENIGDFYDTQAGGETALISSMVSTNIGTIEFTTSNVSPPGAITSIRQTSGATKILDTRGGSSPFSLESGFSGAMGDLTSPDFLEFTLVDTELNNYLFTDPNVLLSGNEMAPSDLTGLVGAVSIFNTVVGGSTIFTFSATDYNVSAVPLPTSVWLFGSGLIGVFSLIRRKKI